MDFFLWSVVYLRTQVFGEGQVVHVSCAHLVVAAQFSLYVLRPLTHWGQLALAISPFTSISAGFRYLEL
jgi:hypothetical protein